MANKNKLLVILTVAILLPNFCSAQTPGKAGPPESVEGLKTTLWRAVKFFPETVVKLAGETLNWLKNIWNSYIYPFLHKIWQKIDSVFGKEIRERKPVIKEEFKQQTEEMKNEIPLVSKSLWQKLKEFFKF